MCNLFHVSWDICAVVSDFDGFKARISGVELNIWLPFGALVHFCQVYLVQVHTCTGSLVVVGSLDRLEVRFLRWRPSLFSRRCRVWNLGIG